MAKPESSSAALPPLIHSELNSGNVSKERLEQLRQEFSGNPEALSWINSYDFSSEDTEQFAKLINASRSGHEGLADKAAAALKKLRGDR